MWLDELYHLLDPVVFAAGPFVVRWYGLAYLLSFVLVGIALYYVSKHWDIPIRADDVYTIVMSIALGVVLGGRIWYVIFYNAEYFLQNPLAIILPPWSGMSFHGGLIGAIIGGVTSAKLCKISPLTICDITCIAAAFGLFMGRLANFVNGELWGKETSLPWGVMFDNTGGGAVYRHPSQLYEALLEGLVLFCLLLILSRKKPARPQGTFLGTFLLFYGCARILIEFVRLPDEQLGYLFGTSWITMGQVQSLPLVIAGMVLLVWSARVNWPQKSYLEEVKQ